VHGKFQNINSKIKYDNWLAVQHILHTSSISINYLLICAFRPMGRILHRETVCSEPTPKTEHNKAQLNLTCEQQRTTESLTEL